LKQITARGMAAAYGRRGAQPDAVDVSRYGASPWVGCRRSSLWGGPDPGRLGLLDLVALERGELTWDDLADGFATSVEDIWQGLKRIDGHTDETCFMRPRKRRGVVSGHDYGYRLLTYLEARPLIHDAPIVKSSPLTVSGSDQVKCASATVVLSPGPTSGVTGSADVLTQEADLGAGSGRRG
jgi:hypothetical protein